ncbi:hypothetical protein D3C77_490900 [compost metagenome]
MVNQLFKVTQSLDKFWIRKLRAILGGSILKPFGSGYTVSERTKYGRLRYPRSFIPQSDRRDIIFVKNVNSGHHFIPCRWNLYVILLKQSRVVVEDGSCRHSDRS